MLVLCTFVLPFQRKGIRIQLTPQKRKFTNSDWRKLQLPEVRSSVENRFVCSSCPRQNYNFEQLILFSLSKLILCKAISPEFLIFNLILSLIASCWHFFEDTWYRKISRKAVEISGRILIWLAISTSWIAQPYMEPLWGKEVDFKKVRETLVLSRSAWKLCLFYAFNHDFEHSWIYLFCYKFACLPFVGFLNDLIYSSIQVYAFIFPD